MADSYCAPGAATTQPSARRSLVFRTGLRPLYLVWRGAVTERDSETQVNLGIRRATAGAVVTGHEPWSGRIDALARSARRVAIRLPSHAHPEQAVQEVDGKVPQGVRHPIYRRLPWLDNPPPAAPPPVLPSADLPALW